MNVEEDFSRLPFNACFVDSKCRNLQRILREIPDYEDMSVVRKHWGDDWKLDPFFIQSEDAEDMILLEPEILEVLSDSELLSFIDVEMQHIECYENTSWLIIAIMILTPVAIINTIMTMSIRTYSNFVRALGLSLALVTLTLILGIIYLRRRRSVTLLKRNIDLVSAQESETFLSAMRKLVTLPRLLRSQEYRERLQYIERTLSGVES